MVQTNCGLRNNIRVVDLDIRAQGYALRQDPTIKPDIVNDTNGLYPDNGEIYIFWEVFFANPESADYPVH